MTLDRFFFLDRRQIPWLDSLRALAILLVVIRHVFDRPYYHLVGDQILSNDVLWLKLLAGFGWSGVTLFFIISGFLVGGSIVLEIRSGIFNWRQFAIKRFLRVYIPAALFLTLMAFISRWSISSVSGLHNYFFIANYTRDIWFSHYWSLAVEEHFYIFLPIVGICFSKEIRRCSLVSLGIAILAFATGFSFFRLVAAQSDLITNVDDYYRLSHWQFDYFAVGIALRIFYEHRKSRSVLFFFKLGRLLNMTIIIMFAIVMMALSWIASNADGNTLLRQQENSSASGITYFCNAIYFGTLLFFLSTSNIAGGWVSKLMRLVAAISFSTYIVHILVLERTLILYQPLLGISSPTIVFLAALTIGLGTSLASGLLFFILVERPVLLLRDQLLKMCCS